MLRGPQGTLYGASSLGGLINFVTVDPSSQASSGHVQAGTNGVSNGDEAGYELRGAVNVPLSSTIAVRVSAFARQDPGYIDNVTTGRQDVNRERASGGHLAGLWHPKTTSRSSSARSFKRSRDEALMK